MIASLIRSQNVYVALWFFVAFAWLCTAMQVAHERRRRQERERWARPRVNR